MFFFSTEYSFFFYTKPVQEREDARRGFDIRLVENEVQPSLNDIDVHLSWNGLNADEVRAIKVLLREGQPGAVSCAVCVQARGNQPLAEICVANFLTIQ